MAAAAERASSSPEASPSPRAAGGELVTQRGQRQHVKGTEDYMDKARFPQLSASIVENAARSGKPMKTPLLMLNEIVIRQRFHLKCEYAMVGGSESPRKVQRVGGVMVLDTTASHAAETRSFVATLTLLPNAACKGVASEPEPVAVGSWSARSKKEAKQHAAAMLLENMMTSGLADSAGAWKGGRGGASDTTAADEQQQAAQAAEKKPEPSEALSECPHTVKLLLEFLKASDPSWEKQDKSCIMVLHEFSTRKNLQLSFDQVQVGYTAMNTPITQLSASVRMGGEPAAADSGAEGGGGDRDGSGAGSAGDVRAIRETCEIVTSGMVMSGKAAKQWVAARLLEKLLGRFPHEEFIAPPRGPKERKRKRKNSENKGEGKRPATTEARGADADAYAQAAEGRRLPLKSPTAPNRTGSWSSIKPARMGMPMAMQPSGPRLPAHAYFPPAPLVYASPMMERHVAMPSPSTMVMQPHMMQPELLRLQPPQLVPTSLRTPSFGANNIPAHFPVLPAPVGAPPTHNYVIDGPPSLWTPAPPFP